MGSGLAGARKTASVSGMGRPAEAAVFEGFQPLVDCHVRAPQDSGRPGRRCSLGRSGDCGGCRSALAAGLERDAHGGDRPRRWSHVRTPAACGECAARDAWYRQPMAAGIRRRGTWRGDLCGDDLAGAARSARPQGTVHGAVRGCLGAFVGLLSEHQRGLLDPL